MGIISFKFIFITDIFEKYDEDDVIKKLEKIDHIPVILLINKIDLATDEQVKEKIALWRERFPTQEIIPISALMEQNIGVIFDSIVEKLPFHPPYFDKDQLTDNLNKQKTPLDFRGVFC